MRPAIVVILSLFLAVPLAAGQGTITTVAGTGVPGFSGDGGPATSAKLHTPQGLAVDSAGNLYIADWNNMRLRKVSAAGVITTVAGNGLGDFTGENGRATGESLWFPRGVAVDSTGNLYIADSQNQRIRKVTPNGWMTTIAGGGDCCGLRDGGPATRAVLDSPYDVAVDANGNVYIADRGHHRVRRVGPHGEITTVAGYGGANFLGSNGSPALGDGGPAKSAIVGFPECVALDPAGNMYIAGGPLRRVSPSGTITTVAGGGPCCGGFYEGMPATSLRFDIDDVAVDANGNLYIASDFRVLKVNPSGTLTTVAGGGTDPSDGIPAINARLGSISAMAVDAAGNIYVSDTETHRIRKITR